ncbi:MAG: uridine kinase [Finegoldia magna]|uniref:uridine kinase n=1 Tax=Finegoldia magna TaxID=1260 RepID=UPI002889DCBE|nr:uridine kinase [Finegoldia magna]MDU5369595.1 uridine kinase [Finegoldia magna]MDU5443993.1 uridine kinase [Finegoldia magna]MDU5978246.1 uridine kinase [Finegoldia magna]MDU7385715.1 uridine kinase [Finegoldia magna]
MKPYIVGVAGGSASGKTEIVKTLKKHFEDKIEIIEHDNYYFAHDNLSMDERASLNYDHPQAFETDLLIEHVKNIINNEEIHIPTYDFTVHTRSSETVKKIPKPIVIVEGILVLENEELRDLMDMKVFVDCDGDVRLKRRITRDLVERNRTIESILTQYMETVKPMHELFVEPSKKFADLIVPKGGKNKVAIDVLINHLATKL